jgi:hypothetical protein
MRIWEKKDFLISIIHIHPLYFVCPDVLVAVGETSCGIQG